MSTKYRHGHEVPSNILCKRLDELSRAVINGRDSINREFTMRVPAEIDRDPDLVLSEAARRINSLEAKNNKKLQMDAQCYCETAESDDWPCKVCMADPSI